MQNGDESDPKPTQSSSDANAKPVLDPAGSSEQQMASGAGAAIDQKSVPIAADTAAQASKEGEAAASEREVIQSEASNSKQEIIPSEAVVAEPEASPVGSSKSETVTGDSASSPQRPAQGNADQTGQDLMPDQEPMPDQELMLNQEPMLNQELMPNYSDDYYQMNAGAHRRRATNLDAPALIWHRAFWIPAPSSLDNPQWDIARMEAERRKARAECKDRIDALVLEFYRFLADRAENVRGKPAIAPSIAGQIVLFNKVVSDQQFEPVPKLDKAVQDVLDGDNRVVSLRFCWDGIEVTARMELHTEYFTITTFAEIGASAVLASWLAGLRQYLGGGDADEQQVAALREFFFHEFWKQRVDRMANDPALQAILIEPTFKNVFADFRGIVLSDRKQDGEAPLDTLAPADPTWGDVLAQRLLPLFTRSTRYECTASYMLDGRALHMTTLGPQLPETGLAELSPLEYILHARESDRSPTEPAVLSKWQLGGLADRIHLLGTVRLASLKYLPQLRQASTRIVELGEYFKKARSEQTGEVATLDLQQARERFADITGKFNAETRTDTGISYRIERARYYIAQFNANVVALRLRRFEGYQRYDEFIAHRLGPVFDFIDRLGQRYERAVRAMSLLEQSYLSIRTHEVARRTHDVATRTEEVDEDIRKIQAYGEVILLGVLVPYYLTSLAEHIVVHDWVTLLGMIFVVVGVATALSRLAAYYKKATPSTQVLIWLCSAVVATGLMWGIYKAGIIRKDEPMGGDQQSLWGPVDLRSVKYLQEMPQPAPIVVKPAPDPAPLVSKPEPESAKPKMKRRHKSRSRH